MSEFKKILELDLYHLDDSLLSYPQLVEEWNSKTVEADITAMNAKNAMDDKKAFLDQDIREFPGNYGLTGVKLTEGIVTAAVNSDSNLKKLTEEYYKLLTEHKRLKSKCGSIATVGKSLDLLTELFKAGYFTSKPICAMASTIIQEKETTKLNTDTNKTKLRNAQKPK